MAEWLVLDCSQTDWRATQAFGTARGPGPVIANDRREGLR